VAASDHPAWWLLVLGLLAWQIWMTLGLFGGERPWESLLDDRPILSGRHPLHLYHGYLGARALHEHGTLSCYDPSFHAGYPKTPVFDSGSRPAELALALVGGRYSPAAYKIGVALIYAVVPLLLFGAAQGVGLGRAAACLACVLGLLVWWGQPCRDSLEAGEVDMLLATVLILAQIGLLISYHRDAGLLNWLGLLGTTLLGWLAHPLLMALALPLFLVYYLSVGTRHRLAWHLALLVGLLAAVGINGFWLIDWVGYWWIRVPPHLETPLLTEPNLSAVWTAPFWGGPVDRALACGLVVGAAAGVVLFNQSGHRVAARMLGLAWVGFLVLSVAGLLWEPLERFGVPGLLVPALLFATLPASNALRASVGVACRWRSMCWASVAGLIAGGVYLWHEPPPALAEWGVRFYRGPSLQLGLDADQQKLVDALRQHTSSGARILWEDRRTTPQTPQWAVLLPLLTEREYIGGLDPEAGIEHTANGLCDAALIGKPVREWQDDMLREYCKRYNIGWVVCWSSAASERFRKWDRAELTATLPPCAQGEPPGCLFTVRRRHSYALLGSAQWLGADPDRIVLGDVAPPQSGVKVILLSLHHQAGMRVSPSRVVIDSFRPEKPGWPSDSTPLFVRLRVDEPVTRVTITWEKR
jgi:hypothetical protein